MFNAQIGASMQMVNYTISGRAHGALPQRFELSGHPLQVRNVDKARLKDAQR